MPLLVALIHLGFIQANSARILVDLFMNKFGCWCTWKQISIRLNNGNVTFSPKLPNCHSVNWSFYTRFHFSTVSRRWNDESDVHMGNTRVCLLFLVFGVCARVYVSHSYLECFCISYICSAYTQFIQVTTSISMEKEKSRAASQKRNSPKITPFLNGKERI